MTLAALPVFMKLAGRPVMLIGEGEAADAKRRLLERAGATIVGENSGEARLAVVAVPEPKPVVERLRARGVLVNAVDHPALCDFTLPAIVDRNPVLVAIGTAGVSAGLAAALRQRLEALLPERLGRLAEALHAARLALRERWPEAADRRRAIGAALSGVLDPMRDQSDTAVAQWLSQPDASDGTLLRFTLKSRDPDDLTLRQARALALADRIYHGPDVPVAILDRARADAVRVSAPAPDQPPLGNWVELEMEP